MSSSTSAVNSQYNNIVNSQPSTDAVSGPQQTLTQNNFLQLLVAQMENQDPLQPQSDTEMASQMAQFTSLTQATAMSSSLSMMQANSLIGSTVGVQIDSTHSASGTVTGVDLSSGTPQILINGTGYSLSQITSVTPPSANNTTGATTPATPSSSDGTTTPTPQTTN